MAKRRPSGDGMVRKREDGRWEGRIVVGHKENGDSIFRYVYADTQKELTAKLRQHIDIYQGVDLTEQSRMTLGEWLDQWLKNIAGTIRPTTLTRYQGAVRIHINPRLGGKSMPKSREKISKNCTTLWPVKAIRSREKGWPAVPSAESTPCSTRRWTRQNRPD